MSTTQHPTITVTGTSSLTHPAERGVATLVVVSESTSQEAVAQDVRGASAALKALLTSLSPKDQTSSSTSPPTPTADAPVTKWSNSSLSTSSYLAYLDDSGTSKERERRYSARMSYEVWFRDFERLGEVATTLSTMDFVSVDGIKWCLTDETTERLGRKGRGDAMRDAVLRARDYAEALRGAGVVGVEDGTAEGIHMLEVVEESANGGLMDHRRNLRAYATGGGAMEESGLEFTPEDVHLETRTTVKFEVV